MTGEPETYTVINYVTEMAVVGKPWVTWPGATIPTGRAPRPRRRTRPAYPPRLTEGDNTRQRVADQLRSNRQSLL